MSQGPASPNPVEPFTREQVTLALASAGIGGLEDPGVVARALSQTLRQANSAFATLPFDLEPSHYRLVLERPQQ